MTFFGESEGGEITFFVFDYFYKGKIRASAASEKPDRNFLVTITCFLDYLVLKYIISEILFRSYGKIF